MRTCNACRAKTEEIERLTAQVHKLMDALTAQVLPPRLDAVPPTQTTGRFDPRIEDALAAQLADMPPDVVRAARKRVAAMLRQKADVEDILRMIERGESNPLPFNIEAF